MLAESGAIGIVVSVCLGLGRADLIMPLIGSVVGLHLLPLARAFADVRFVVAGLLLTAVSRSALCWRPPLRQAVSGIGAGAFLWKFALWTSLQGDPVARAARAAAPGPG